MDPGALIWKFAQSMWKASKCVQTLNSFPLRNSCRILRLSSWRTSTIYLLHDPLASDELINPNPMNFARRPKLFSLLLLPFLNSNCSLYTRRNTNATSRNCAHPLTARWPRNTSCFWTMAWIKCTANIWSRFSRRGSRTSRSANPGKRTRTKVRDLVWCLFKLNHFSSRHLSSFRV